MEPVKQDYKSDWISFEATEAAENSACLQKMSVLLMSLPIEMRGIFNLARTENWFYANGIT